MGYITHEEARDRLRAFKENLAKLDGCKGHDFQRSGERIKCSVCGGLVTDDQKRWYELGVGHGKAGLGRKKQ